MSSRIVVMLAPIDRRGPELRAQHVAGVMSCSGPPQHTHLVLRVGRLAAELAEQPRSDSGAIQRKW